jgi:hypothetical protein
MKIVGSSFPDPFHEEIARYPVRFAQPVFFGQSPVLAYSAELASGTGSLLRFDDKFIGVTCLHVLTGYRRKLEEDPAIIFHFGRIQLNPEQYIIAESAELDLVTLDLTSFVGAVGGIDPQNFVSPIRWPPPSVTTDDVFALAGFPGIWRERASLGYLRFYSFSSGTISVYSIGEQHFIMRLYEEEAQAVVNYDLVLGSIGGLSGGPVFVWRRTPILFPELVGFIMEYQDIYDLLYIRRATCLDSTGRFLV